MRSGPGALFRVVGSMVMGMVMGMTMVMGMARGRPICNGNFMPYP